jgi:hypothetical protein
MHANCLCALPIVMPMLVCKRRWGPRAEKGMPAMTAMPCQPHIQCECCWQELSASAAAARCVYCWRRVRLAAGSACHAAAHCSMQGGCLVAI